MATNQRHPSVTHFDDMFASGHLREDLRGIVEKFEDMRAFLVENLQDGPELSACLRKLVEAKDCAVRQAAKDSPRE